MLALEGVDELLRVGADRICKTPLLADLAEEVQPLVH